MTSRMSDPNRPPQGELTEAQETLAVAPDAFLNPTDDYNRFWSRAGHNADACKGMLGPLRLEPANSVPLTPKLAGEVANTEGKQVLARAFSGPGLGRKRSEVGKSALNMAFLALPAETRWGTRDEIEARIEKTIKWENPGTEACLGRLAAYFPRRRIEGLPGPSLSPPLEKEVSRALHNCGLAITSRPRAREDMSNEAAFRSYPLRPVGDEPRITYTKGASNGLPTMGDSANAKDIEHCLRIAIAMRKKYLDPAFQAEGHVGIQKEYRRLLASKDKRQLFVLLGKAKADFYSREKILHQMLRFYTVWPRWIQFVIQQASSPMKACKKHILSPRSPDEPSETEREGRHSFMGASLSHGGADRLVTELDAQLDEMEMAWVHMGDDTWVVLRFDNGFIAMFSVDMTSFDLTQWYEVASPVNYGIWTQMLPFGGVSASLWYAIQEYREVVVHGQYVYGSSDAGPSGGIAQSEKNDLLCDVGLQRLRTEYAKYRMAHPYWNTGHAPASRTDIERLAKNVFTAMGFIPKVEDFVAVRAETLREALAHVAFLFVGYRFYLGSDGVVNVFCDLPRALSQLPYPSAAPDKKLSKPLFLERERVRVAGVVLSMGVPPGELLGVYTAIRSAAISGLFEAMAYAQEKGIADSDLYFPGDFCPWGVESMPPDLMGLYKALLASPSRIWTGLAPDRPFPAHKPEKEFREDANWAESMLEAEEEEVKAAYPAAAPLPPPLEVAVGPPADLALKPVSTKSHGGTPAGLHTGSGAQTKANSGTPLVSRPSRTKGGARARAAAEEDEELELEPNMSAEVVEAYEQYARLQDEMEAAIARSEFGSEVGSEHESDLDLDEARGVEVSQQEAEDFDAHM